MAKQKIVTLDGYDPNDFYTMEHPTGESKTVPGEAMTVREIYDRFVRGQDVNENDQRSGVFMDDDDNFDSVDLEKLAQGWTLDAQEYLQELKLDIDIKREKLNNFLKAQLEQKTAPASDASASPQGSESDDSGDMSEHKKPAKPAKVQGAKGGAKRSESDD